MTENTYVFVYIRELKSHYLNLRINHRESSQQWLILNIYVY